MFLDQNFEERFVGVADALEKQEQIRVFVVTRRGCRHPKTGRELHQLCTRIGRELHHGRQRKPDANSTILESKRDPRIPLLSAC